jgi:hypothetical protein
MLNKSAGTNQIPAELIQAGGNTLIILGIRNKEELPQQGNESISVIRVIKPKNIAVAKYIRNIIQHSAFKANPIRRRNYW